MTKKELEKRIKRRKKFLKSLNKIRRKWDGHLEANEVLVSYLNEEFKALKYVRKARTLILEFLGEYESVILDQEYLLAKNKESLQEEK